MSSDAQQSHSGNIPRSLYDVRRTTGEYATRQHVTKWQAVSDPPTGPFPTRYLGAKVALHSVMKTLIRLSLVGLVFSGAVFSPAQASAQLPIPRLEIAGGVSKFELAGTGTAPFGAVRVDLPLTALIVEGSLGAFRPQENFGVHHVYIVPEGQVQLQLFPAIIRPYIGVGGGWMRAVSGPDPRRNDVTGSLSAGIRAGLPGLPFALRGEVRLRGIGSNFSQRASEYTIGLSR